MNEKISRLKKKIVRERENKKMYQYIAPIK